MIMDTPEMIVERIRDVVKRVVKMLPSQEEPVMDPGGLWYAGWEGVMIMEIVV